MYSDLDSYFRKTLFDLSLFIPQKYYYAEEYQGSKLLANRIELMINSWAERVLVLVG
ncbi:hypothetical protein [Streptococcus equi]|uniref:hypothetical protein n=1 Tax=Streptococcus equi TaxID=1336 RepID=UPI001E5412E3|nr:hypothetical protein [Streptococcus equi]